LRTGLHRAADAQGDTLSGIENLTGSNFADVPDRGITTPTRFKANAGK